MRIRKKIIIPTSTSTTHLQHGGWKAMTKSKHGARKISRSSMFETCPYDHVMVLPLRLEDAISVTACTERSGACG